MNEAIYFDLNMIELVFNAQSAGRTFLSLPKCLFNNFLPISINSFIDQEDELLPNILATLIARGLVESLMSSITLAKALVGSTISVLRNPSLDFLRRARPTKRSYNVEFGSKLQSEMIFPAKDLLDSSPMTS